MEGFTPEDLKRIVEIKNITANVERTFKGLNKEFQTAGHLVAEVSREFKDINKGADQFVKLQDEATKSSSATLKAIKEQTKQQNVVRTLNIQIDDLYNRSLKSNEKTSRILLRQADTLSVARDSAQGLVNSFGDLAKSSAKIDSSTVWFSAFSEFVGDIKGLRKLSSPFDAAAQASRETVLNNAKSQDILDRIGQAGEKEVENGEGLTKERLKQLNLTDITQGKTGEEAAKMLRNAKSTSKVQSVSLNGLKAGFKGLGPIVTKALGPLALLKMAADAIKFVFDAMVAGSVATADMSRNMLISRDAAGELYSTTIPGVVGQFNQLSNAAGGVSVTIGAYEKALSNINNELGLQLNLTEDFGTQTQLNVGEVAKMTENFGYSAKASKELFFESIKTGKPLEQINKDIFGAVGGLAAATGIIPDFAKLLDEAAGVTGNLKANFGGSVERIAKATFQAKLLGLSLAQTEGISSNLLDFQSSIENEMAAELLLGKELNLEKAREAALMGDTETLMNEISKQAGSQKDFLALNIVQRQALAKAVGMEVNELADMFDKQAKMDALRKLNQQKINELKAAGLNIDDKNFDIQTASLQEIMVAAKAASKSEAEIRKILGDQIYLRKQEEDATQKFNKALGMAKDAFARLVGDGAILDKLADILIGLTESSLFQGFAEEGEAKRLASKVAEDEKAFEKEDGRTDEQKLIDAQKAEAASTAVQSTGAATGTSDFKRLVAGFLAGGGTGALAGGIPTGGIGAIPGAVIGAITGLWMASKENTRRQEQADKDLESAKIMINPETVDDFIIRPGQRPLKFNKGDLLMGGTSLGKGGNSDDEVVTLLKELIGAVKQGGDVYIDGAKAGRSLALATSKMG
jgi:hypothetical protein